MQEKDGKLAQNILLKKLLILLFTSGKKNSCHFHLFSFYIYIDFKCIYEFKFLLSVWAKRVPLTYPQHYSLLSVLLVAPQPDSITLWLKTLYTHVIKHGGIELMPNQETYLCRLPFMELSGKIHATQREKQSSISSATNPKRYNWDLHARYTDTNGNINVVE